MYDKVNFYSEVCDHFRMFWSCMRWPAEYQDDQNDDGVGVRVEEDIEDILTDRVLNIGYDTHLGHYDTLAIWS